MEAKLRLGENKDNEIVSIPGLRGREPREISLKTLSKIINARVVEIIEQVFLEIKNYGHSDQKNKLIAGIVLTGGGSQLNHLKQLVEYITGMDTRIGYPGEHLAGDSDKSTGPIFSTAVGLLMNAIENKKSNSEFDKIKMDNEINENSSEQEEILNLKNKKTIFEKWVDKFKEFLDNA